MEELGQLIISPDDVLLGGVRHCDALLVLVVVHVAVLHGAVDGLGRLLAPCVHQSDVGVKPGVTLNSQHLTCKQIPNETRRSILGSDCAMENIHFLLYS